MCLLLPAENTGTTLKPQLNGSGGRSFLPYCDVQQSAEYYRIRKKFRARTGQFSASVVWLYFWTENWMRACSQLGKGQV